MRRRWLWLCGVAGLVAVGCGPTSCSMVEWSPDGKKLVTLVPAGKDGSALAIVDVQTGARQTVPSSDHALAPSWSPDGRRIAFLHDPSDEANPRPGQGDARSVRVYNVSTRGIEASFEAGGGPLSWTPDSQYIVTCREVGDSEFDLVWYSVADREATRAVHLPKGDLWPFNTGIAWLPDGQGLVIGITQDLWLVRGDETTQLTHTNDVIGFGLTSDRRSLLLARKGTPKALIVLQRMDLRTRAVSRLPLAGSGADAARSEAAFVVFSPSGDYAAVLGGPRGGTNGASWLRVVPLDGSPGRTVWSDTARSSEEVALAVPAFSRDGRRLAVFTAAGKRGTVFVCEADGSRKRTLMSFR